MAALLITYQAQLSQVINLTRVNDMAPAINRIGGRVEFCPTRTAGVTTVRLHLPHPYTPDHFLPELPFYPQ